MRENERLHAQTATSPCGALKDLLLGLFEEQHRLFALDQQVGEKEAEVEVFLQRRPIGGEDLLKQAKYVRKDVQNEGRLKAWHFWEL